MARLAIADPPYPPLARADGTTIPRASRWYGSGQVSASDVAADVHDAAAEWDDHARHRALLLQLAEEYDGWAIATSADGLAAYEPIPAGARLMVWVRDSEPGANRIRHRWEPVILYPPRDRRSNIGRGQVSDVLMVPHPSVGFRGAKPLEWVTWVLDAMSYDADTDTVDDLFPGSGLVTAGIAQQRLYLS